MQAVHIEALLGMPPENFLLDITIAAFGRCFVLGQKLWKVEDPNSEAFIVSVRPSHLEGGRSVTKMTRPRGEPSCHEPWKCSA